MSIGRAGALARDWPGATGFGSGAACFSAAWICDQAGADQKWIRPFQLHAAMVFPSGEKVIPVKKEPLPPRVATSSLEARSQSLIASRPLLPAATRWPSGENVTEW